jgi:hypothetical protein
MQRQPRHSCTCLQLLLRKTHGLAVGGSPIAGCFRGLHARTRHLLVNGLKQLLVLLRQRLDNQAALPLSLP